MKTYFTYMFWGRIPILKQCKVIHSLENCAYFNCISTSNIYFEIDKTFFTGVDLL